MKYFSILFLIFILFDNTTIFAQWVQDPNENNPVCIIGGQYSPSITTDVLGNIYITWCSNRDGNKDIYVQKFNSEGYIQWVENGVPICTNPANQRDPDIIDDEKGGVIVSWLDTRNGSMDNDVYVQRVSSSGEIMWEQDGIPLSNHNHNQQNPKITKDENGGAIVAWNQVGLNFDIYAQKVDSAGLLKWGESGTPISYGHAEFFDDLVSDGNGGAIFVYKWAETPGPNKKLRAKRKNDLGETIWLSLVSTSSFKAENALVTSDGNGGAFIIWLLETNTQNLFELFIQYINSSGEEQFVSNGIRLSEENKDVIWPDITNDGSGNAIVSWACEGKIYAQKISPDGSFLWGENGVVVVDGNYWSNKLTDDGNGGAIVAWSDIRNGSENRDIYAQRINYEGEIMWNPDGAIVSSATGPQEKPEIVGDNIGGAVLTWVDGRNPNGGLYAQKIFNNGYVPVELTSFTIDRIGKNLILNWTTATELNNHGFEIQRSIDKEKWETIGFKEGNGTTSEQHSYSFADKINLSGANLYYRLKQIDYNGSFTYSDIVELIAPTEFSLHQNYPNPFNPTTTIKFAVGNWQLAKGSSSPLERGGRGVLTKLTIYDILGREVTTLVNEVKQPGIYEVEFNGSNLSSGIYYYRLTAGNYTSVKKMIFIK